MMTKDKKKPNRQARGGFRKSKLTVVSVALLTVYFYASFLAGTAERDNYNEFDFVLSFVRFFFDMRSELIHVYQLSIGLAYLSGLGLFIRPFVCLGGFNHLFRLIYAG